jgi:hypothetical protein
VREVFTESAAIGHLEVLKLMMGMERIKRHMKLYHGGALPLSIAAQHTDVVDFLLEKPEFDWNFKDALEEALALGQTATAELIYNVYPRFKENTTSFAELAYDGRKDSIEYIFNNGRREPELVCDAFVRGSKKGSIDVLSFLHDTGLISLDTFKKAWEHAAICWPSNSPIMLFLYGLKRASSLMVNQWFERVNNLEVLKLLYENEVTHDSAIVEAFYRAVCCASKDAIEIVTFLYQNKAITSDAIDKCCYPASNRCDKATTECLSPHTQGDRRGICESS